ELPGRVIENVWELMAGSPHQVALDVEAAAPSVTASALDVAVIGPAGHLRIGEDVTIEPGVVIDTTDGPVWLDDGVTVRAFTRLAGPSYVGPDSTLLGGTYSAVVTGPVCKVH